MAPPRKNTAGTCSRCGTTDPTAFTPSGLNRRTAWCKECFSVYRRQKLPGGRPRASQYQENRRRRTIEWLWQLRAERGCERCGEKDPCCLDFHHKDESTKSFSIGSKIHIFGREKREAEIAKCIVLCSNCHRKLHYHEKSGVYTPRK